MRGAASSLGTALTACQLMHRRVGLPVHDEAVAGSVTGEVQVLVRCLGEIFGNLRHAGGVVRDVACGGGVGWIV